MYRIFKKELKKTWNKKRRHSRAQKDSYYEKATIWLLMCYGIFENIFYKQIAPQFKKKNLKCWTGFGQGFNPQNCWATVIKNFRNSLYRGGQYAALLTDLSKALDCLPHDLIIANSNAYGLDTRELTSIITLKVSAALLNMEYRKVQIYILFCLIHFCAICSFCLIQ